MAVPIHRQCRKWIFAKFRARLNACDLSDEYSYPLIHIHSIIYFYSEKHMTHCDASIENWLALNIYVPGALPRNCDLKLASTAGDGKGISNPCIHYRGSGIYWLRVNLSWLSPACRDCAQMIIYIVFWIALSTIIILKREITQHSHDRRIKASSVSYRDRYHIYTQMVLFVIMKYL